MIISNLNINCNKVTTQKMFKFCFVLFFFFLKLCCHLFHFSIKNYCIIFQKEKEKQGNSVNGRMTVKKCESKQKMLFSYQHKTKAKVKNKQKKNDNVI